MVLCGSGTARDGDAALCGSGTARDGDVPLCSGETVRDGGMPLCNRVTFCGDNASRKLCNPETQPKAVQP